MSSTQKIDLFFGSIVVTIIILGAIGLTWAVKEGKKASLKAQTELVQNITECQNLTNNLQWCLDKFAK